MGEIEKENSYIQGKWEHSPVTNEYRKSFDVHIDDVGHTLPNHIKYAFSVFFYVFIIL